MELWAWLELQGEPRRGSVDHYLGFVGAFGRHSKAGEHTGGDLSEAMRFLV
jgi:hypothetical protein